MYKLNSISEHRWLFISADDSFDEPDAFFVLFKEYQAEIEGKISEVSNDFQYAVTNIPLNLIFQWDSLFCIAVTVPLETTIIIAKILIITCVIN